MRKLEEIKQTKGLNIVQYNEDEGIMATYRETTWNNRGNIKLGQLYTIVFTWNNGWEHLSVATANRTPSWDEMCMFKDIFFKEDEACVQYHPKKEDYVNLHPHCLHIWKPKFAKLPLPNPRLVY